MSRVSRKGALCLRDPEVILLPNEETSLAILRDAEAILQRKTTFGSRVTTFGTIRPDGKSGLIEGGDMNPVRPKFI